MLDSRPGVLGIFLLDGSLLRRPLPSTGSAGARSPASWYYKAFRLLVTRPAALRCLRLAVPSAARSFETACSPSGAFTRPGGLFTGFPSPEASRMEMTRAPRFLEDPLARVPCSSTPARPRRPATLTLRCCLPRDLPRRLSPQTSFRGSITRPTYSLSTLRSRGRPRTTQDSLPGGGQPFPDGLSPLGPERRFRLTLP